MGVIPTRMMPMGAWRKSAPPLPYDAEVEYVKSDGTQWTDTGIVATGATTTTLDARMISTATRNSGFFGAYSSGRAYYLYLDASGVFQFGFGAYKNSSNSSNTRRHVFELDDYQFLVDGTVAGTTSRNAFSTPWTLAMFKTRSSASAFYAAPPVEVYGCQISQSGTLARDFIPVRVGTAGALYDRVSGTLYYSATSTALIPGPDLP